MKSTVLPLNIKNYIVYFTLLTCFFGFSQNITEFKGIVLDKTTNNPLALADLIITNSNVSTIANSDGEFTLKVPEDLLQNNVTISYLGYQKLEVALSEFKQTDTKIYLQEAATVLAAIDIAAPKDAEELVKKVLNLKGDNYATETVFMTGFYRETIKKRNRNASLSEAIVSINKSSYNSSKNDDVTLIKARKNTDYSRLDTIALKIQGGPFSSLHTDIIKYPEYIFNDETLSDYTFTFGRSTQVDNQLVYVVNFKQKENVYRPLYYGTLFIDANNYALTSAVFNLNVENQTEATKLFVRKKPRKANVYPTEAAYKVNYRTKDGKWYFAYSNILISFKVNWDNRWFNSRYTLQSEMAITDWNINKNLLTNTQSKKLKQNSILQDQVSGFRDPDFWGEYNIIEPEKSIETAIKKIKRQVEKN